ncbi:polysaccharide biosynthesis C-terminal domain-containing protein [Fibrella sp. HMF5335]|uniref:Polysaccharide biosynthesis C-terminal domain-containing protein n=1 Tax=Fibrella rubiginis TaxID=2817060 RepID=A0A939GEI9_9BACT|nr:polysaccharide biosynthesis C-terminal domain-containing protein [Fibrella rubiginis]MBO0934968.1 polysaccharide biosynthesis C-terminal domain-containing protein [Fibrella rubiginis]
MTLAATWHRLTDFVADTWQRTAALWWSQGISVGAGVAYGKLTALFVTPAVLGAYNLQLATTMLLHGIVVSPTIQAYMSALQQYPPARAKRFYVIVLAVVYSVALLGTALYAAAHQVWLLGLLMWLSTCLQGVYLLNSGYFTAYGHIRKLALMQALSPLANLILLVTLISSGFPVTTPALWVCVVLLNGLLWLVSVYATRRFHVAPVLSPQPPAHSLAGHLRRYALPLFTQAIFSWLTNYVDKYIVGLLLTEAAVGYYSAGYSMGARVAMLGAPLVTRLTVSVYALRRASEPPRAALPVLKKSLLFLWLMGGGVVVLLFIFSDQIGALFLSSRYEPSFGLIPVVAVAFLFLSSTQLVDSSFLAYEKTTYILFYSVSTAVSNIGLNFLLIPRYGISGAAFAMALSMAFQFTLVLGLYRRLLATSVTPS